MAAKFQLQHGALQNYIHTYNRDINNVKKTRSSAIAKSTARPSCLGGVLSHIYWQRIC